MTSRFAWAVLACGMVAACVVPMAAGDDWPQWRGPDRNGIAVGSVPLVDALPLEGMKPFWSSEPIKSSDDGGYGSPVVAAGKVYLYQNLNLPAQHRILYKARFDGFGYAADMPADLSKAVEEARAGDERKGLDNRAVDPWVKDWLDTHLTADQRKWRGAAQARLKAGAGAVPLDLVAKLLPIVDKRFETIAELDAWTKANGFDEALQKKIRDLTIPGEEKTPRDSVFCFDAATGKTLWRAELSGQWFYYSASSTPTIAGGRIYVYNSEARVFCLDAQAGTILWKSDALAPSSQHHNRSSSPLLVDGVIVVVTDACTAGFDSATGKILWQNGGLRSEQSSAVKWTAGGKNFVLVNASGKLVCLDPKDGKAAWEIACGGACTPGIVGDVTSLSVGGNLGLVAYKLTPEKAVEAWKVAWKDGFSGPLIHDGFVYALGNAFEDRNQGKATCVELATGQVKWEQVVGQAQHSSPIFADGKIIAINGTTLLLLKATPEKYTQLGQVNTNAVPYCSPALAGGSVFIRTYAGVACYKLAK